MTPTEFRDWRKGQGFTQKQAAEALGLSIRAVSMYERGWRVDCDDARKGRPDGRPVVIPRVVDLACHSFIVADLAWDLAINGKGADKMIDALRKFDQYKARQEESQ